jgi:aspartate aminotransferase-like enzyme
MSKMSFRANYEKLLMTPGPTIVDERVRQAMARPIVNPDLDMDFFDLYRDLCCRLGSLMGTNNDVLILSGEGLLGLESAVISLVEPGDKVLCVANGHFGEGFGEFVQIAGGQPIYLSGPYDRILTSTDVEKVLQQHPDIRLATIVHCETPSGLLNPVADLIEPLKERGILSIVDAVSSIGGENVAADTWGIDVVLGASQKALSAPPGLALISISPRAWERMEKRRSPIRSYYLNLVKWRDMWLNNSVFPYTPSISDIYALDAAVDILTHEGLDNAINRHFRLAEATRNALRAAGLTIFPQPDAAANTVTAFCIPEGVDDESFRENLWQDHGVMLAGSWGKLASKVWRIGHMGSGAHPENLLRFFAAFDAAAKQAGLPLATSTLTAFAAQL